MYYEINVARRRNLEESNSYSHFFATAPRSITSEEKAKEMLKIFREKFPEPEYFICLNYYPETGEILSVEEFLGEKEGNKLMRMFDIERVKQEIRNCPKDQTVILVPHWSINRPKYTNEEFENQSFDADWDEIEEELGVLIVVTQYDDLVADPHGITIEG